MKKGNPKPNQLKLDFEIKNQVKPIRKKEAGSTPHVSKVVSIDSRSHIYRKILNRVDK